MILINTNLKRLEIGLQKNSIIFGKFKNWKKKPFIYVSFFIDNVKEIFIIEKKLRINQYNVLDCLIAEPRQYFNSLMDEELKKLIVLEDLNK